MGKCCVVVAGLLSSSGRSSAPSQPCHVSCTPWLALSLSRLEPKMRRDAAHPGLQQRNGKRQHIPWDWTSPHTLCLSLQSHLGKRLTKTLYCTKNTAEPPFPRITPFDICASANLLLQTPHHSLIPSPEHFSSSSP